MIAPLRQQRIIRIDPIAVFIARVEARAMRWAADEITLHDAVDELWADVVRDGLVARLGAEKAQELLVTAFAPVRDDLPRYEAVVPDDLLKFEDIETEPIFADDAWSAPGWRDAAVDYHKDRGHRVSVRPYTADDLARLRELMADEVTLERAWHEINHPTDRAAASTVEALMLALRERGVAALAEPAVRQRLAQLDEEQVVKVGNRLQALRPHVAKAWTASELKELAQAWRRARR